jgi:hypothetical protein
MNPFKRIALLTGIVTCIVVFWLMPGINKADDTYYTRRYEDTEVRDSLRVKTKKSRHTTDSVRDKKIYKKERIHSRAKFKDITPKMYSRAIHFEEETELERMAIDSIQRVQTAKSDSAVIRKALN